MTKKRQGNDTLFLSVIPDTDILSFVIPDPDRESSKIYSPVKQGNDRKEEQRNDKERVRTGAEE